MQKEKIVVVGFGWVGQANALALVMDDYTVSYYDIGQTTRHYTEYLNFYDKITKLDKLTSADSEDTYYIICVGDRVDEQGNQDISNIEKTLESLKSAKGVVVLRSTIIPSYLKDLDFDIYLPEFLHEKAAVRECINPQYVPVGKKNKNTKTPSFIELWIKRSFKYIECTPEEASHIKYLSNLWNALRIAFTNEFGTSLELPVDEAAIGRIDNVLNFIFDNQPYLKYGKAYNGHCLPKDSRAYAKWMEDNGKSVPILRNMVVSNDQHLAIESKYPHLKQWFSNWPEQTGSGWVALHILKQSILRNFLSPIEAIKRRKTVVFRKKIK